MNDHKAETKLTNRACIRIAARAGVDPRTIKKHLSGGSVHPAIAAAIDAAVLAERSAPTT
ncbi:MAG TPA: hypothetical protein VF407_17005 [Polyangiaceae bacterium]